jgi:hypothetical protein
MENFDYKKKEEYLEASSKSRGKRLPATRKEEKMMRGNKRIPKQLECPGRCLKARGSGCVIGESL